MRWARYKHMYLLSCRDGGEEKEEKRRVRREMRRKDINSKFILSFFFSPFPFLFFLFFFFLLKPEGVDKMVRRIRLSTVSSYMYLHMLCSTSWAHDKPRFDAKGFNEVHMTVQNQEKIYRYQIGILMTTLSFLHYPKRHAPQPFHLFKQMLHASICPTPKWVAGPVCQFSF